MTGPALDLYRTIKAQVPEVALIASGGVRSRDDVLALQQIGVEATVIGKALLDGTLPLRDLQEFAC
jgi:phosphoribosylformimino-5-aminoimidazole carboxamide ribotide isomerase